MKRLLVLSVSLAASAMLAGQAEAFTSKNKNTVSVSASGVQESTTFEASAIVVQGTADTPGTLSFGAGVNDFRDSGEAIKVAVNTNLAANRIITYTDNFGASASPKACLDTSKGIDGGGLVGRTECSKTVPMVFGVLDNNDDYTFLVRPQPEIGASNANFITDRAHVRTFITKSSAFDNVATKFCSASATHAVPATNTADDGLYPQYFGEAGKDLDICRVDNSQKIPEFEELSKNIAVVAFGFLGTVGTAPNLSTTANDTMAVTSPIYLPIAADFRQATAQDYATNTLTVELVTQ